MAPKIVQSVLDLVKQSPITALTSAEATAAGIVAFLVAHGVIPADIAQQYGPYFVLAYLAAFGAAKWFHVSPWVKAKELAVKVEDGALPDADHQRILAGVADLLEQIGYTAQHAIGDQHPDAVTVGAPSVPTLAAGAPAAG